MEDFAVISRRPRTERARAAGSSSHPFTLVGAIDARRLLSAPFRGRFGLLERLRRIRPTSCARSSRARRDPVGDARRASRARDRRASRGTPRRRQPFAAPACATWRSRRRQRDRSPLALEALRRLGIDEFGLEDLDRRILGTSRATARARSA